MVSLEQDTVASNEAQLTSAGESLRNAKTRIPRNVFSNWASYAVNLLVIFLISPFIVHRLGNAVYGVWALIGQVIEYSFLLDFGIRIAATRYVAHHMALREPHEINRVVSSGLVLSSVSAALALACGSVVAWAL